MTTGTEPASRRVSAAARQHRRELMAAELERLAFDLFAQRGFANVSVDDIAQAAGVSARTFYRYFSVKEDLLGQFPARITVAVRAAFAEEPVDRPLFQAFSSVLMKVTATLDLDELRRWWTVVGFDTGPLRFMTSHIDDIKRDVEPLFARRVPKGMPPLYVELVMAAGQAAMIAASTEWFERGGDLLVLLRQGLDLFGAGFDAVER